MGYDKNKADHCWRGKVYVGAADPYTETYTSPKDWTEVVANDIESFKTKISALANTRFRLHDRVKVKVMNYRELKQFITMCRHNRINEEDGKIEYGLWMIG